MGNYCCGSPSSAERPAVIDMSELQLFRNIKDATDLRPLIDYIEPLLSQIKEERSAQKITTDRVVPDVVKENLGDAAKFMDALSTNGEALNKENFASKLPAEMGNVISSALKQVGHLHWVAVGCSVIAFVLERIGQVSSNFDKCVELLDIMFDIGKRLIVLHERMPNETESLNKAVHAIVDGAVKCCCCMTQGKLFRFLFASTDEANLQNIESVIGRLYRELGLIIAMDIQGAIPRPYYRSNYEAPADVVGIDGKIKDVIGLLNMSGKGPARAVILYGFGGVGKTTLADCVMSKLDLKGFRHSAIRLDEEPSNMERYQKQIHQGLTKENIEFNNSDEGKQKLKEVLEKIKEPTFIFIDNALTSDHISKLLPSSLSLPSGSRILLTSRTVNVSGELRWRNIDCKEYPVTELPDKDAKDYFRKIVLRSEGVRSAIERNAVSLAQIDAVAKECHGVPLILRVYGQYLERHGSDPGIYDDILPTLKGGNFNVDGVDNLSERLLYVYRRFDQNYQDAFVDICTYFHDWEEDDVSSIVGKAELNALVDGALVAMDAASKVTVHDVLRAMGIKEGNETRLRSWEDLTRVLAEKKDLHTIKGIWLDRYLEGSLESQHLIAMKDSIRVLRVSNGIRLMNECCVSFSELRLLWIEYAGGFPILETMVSAPNLRFLQWGREGALAGHKYGSVAWQWWQCTTPLTESQKMCENIKSMKNLKKFVLDSLLIGMFTSGFGLPPSLIEFHARDCPSLWQLPDVPASVRKVKVCGCYAVKELPASFASLKNLQQLILAHCYALENLPADFGCLSSLQSLNLEDMERLMQLPESFGDLARLTDLKLKNCFKLTSLPGGFGLLKSLKILEVSGCSRLTKLPEDFYGLSALEGLYLKHLSLLNGLPIRFGELKRLTKLQLTGCEGLTSLPDDFGDLRALKSLCLAGCESLQSLPDGFGSLKSLESLDLKWCKSLRSLPDGFVNLKTLKLLNLRACEKLARLPNGFDELRTLTSLKLTVCEASKNLLNGFDNVTIHRASESPYFQTWGVAPCPECS